jgi:hypothetical protein
MTVLVTCCKASSRKSASAVCWEEALSAMTDDNRLGRQVRNGKLVMEVEGESETGGREVKRKLTTAEHWQIELKSERMLQRASSTV